MRITSGQFRGRMIFTPDSKVTHPMGSRERLALFNSLSMEFEKVELALDCYCGSGALGLEALSRGVKKVVFVDKNHLATETVQKNLHSLGISPERAEVTTKNLRALQAESGMGEKLFDLILIDPPYDHFVPEEFSFLENMLAQSGKIVLSFPKATKQGSVDPEKIFSHLKMISKKTYAAANIGIFA